MKTLVFIYPFYGIAQDNSIQLRTKNVPRNIFVQRSIVGFFVFVYLQCAAVASCVFRLYPTVPYDTHFWFSHTRFFFFTFCRLRLARPHRDRIGFFFWLATMLLVFIRTQCNCCAYFWFATKRACAGGSYDSKHAGVVGDCCCGLPAGYP